MKSTVDQQSLFDGERARHDMTGAKHGAGGSGEATGRGKRPGGGEEEGRGGERRGG